VFVVDVPVRIGSLGAFELHRGLRVWRQ
jgi:hypothetical protein